MTQLHQSPRSKSSLSDEYETPQELYDQLCNLYGIYPTVDMCANEKNTKCKYFLTDFNREIEYENNDDKWCNPPHSQNCLFVAKSYFHWRRHNCNIMMILPTNTMSSIYWHKCIEGIAEYHPIQGRIKFLIDGKISKFPSRNAYCVVIWRKRYG